jgi:hypothetical protein
MTEFRIERHFDDESTIIAIRPNKMALIVRKGSDITMRQAKLFCNTHDFNLVMLRSAIAEIANGSASVASSGLHKKNGITLGINWR